MIVFVLIVCFAVITSTLTTDVVPFRGFFQRYLFGYKKIYLYDGQYDFNVPFTAYVKVSEDGEFIDGPWRYTSGKIGRVILHKNGTAEYCGEYKWRYA